MKTYEIDEIRNALDLGEYGEYIADYAYSNVYLCDAIDEIADDRTSVAYDDIMQFISKHPEMLTEAVDVGMYDPSKGYDVYAHGRAAEYLYIEHDLYAHIDDMIHLIMCDYIQYELKRDEITEEEYTYLMDYDCGNCDRLSEIGEYVDEMYEDEDEDE